VFVQIVIIGYIFLAFFIYIYIYIINTIFIINISFITLSLHNQHLSHYFTSAICMIIYIYIIKLLLWMNYETIFLFCISAIRKASAYKMWKRLLHNSKQRGKCFYILCTAATRLEIEGKIKIREIIKNGSLTADKLKVM